MAVHNTGHESFFLDLRNESLKRWSEKRLERAMDVVYRPETERVSHYFYADLPEQFDAVIHFDETGAVEPLERWADGTEREEPETFPTGV